MFSFRKVRLDKKHFENVNFKTSTLPRFFALKEINIC